MKPSRKAAKATSMGAMRLKHKQLQSARKAVLKKKGFSEKAMSSPYLSGIVKGRGFKN